MKTIGGYGRYADNPRQVACPRAKSDMTPCVARDGQSACVDSGGCVGCLRYPAELLKDLVWELTDTDQPGWVKRQGSD